MIKDERVNSPHRPSSPNPYKVILTSLVIWEVQAGSKNSQSLTGFYSSGQPKSLYRPFHPLRKHTRNLRSNIFCRKTRYHV